MNAGVCIIKGQWKVRIRHQGRLIKDIPCDTAGIAILTAAHCNSDYAGSMCTITERRGVKGGADALHNWNNMLARIIARIRTPK
jgi:hypothetical protein